MICSGFIFGFTRLYRFYKQGKVFGSTSLQGGIAGTWTGKKNSKIGVEAVNPGLNLTSDLGIPRYPLYSKYKYPPLPKSNDEA